MKRVGKKGEKLTKIRSLADPEFIRRVSPQLGISFEDDKFIKTGDGYITCIYVYKYPSTVYDSWLNDITTALANTAVVIDVTPQNTAEVKRNINRSMEEQDSRYKTAKSNMAAFDAQNRFDELAEMYNEIDRMGKIMELICVRIFVPGKTMHECDERAKECIIALDKFKAGVCLYETKQDYKSLFQPISAQQKSIYRKDLQVVPSRVLAAGNPFHSSSLMDPNGFYWGETDTGGSVLLDIFEKTNVRNSYNALLVGLMGTGKSTILKKLLEDRAKRGDYVRVFDVAGEFKDLTLHLGGKVVALDGESGNHLNALQILRAGESDQISYNQHTAKMATIYQYLRPSADDVELKMFQRILSELYQQMGIITGDSADGYQIAIDIGTYPADEYPLWSDVKTRIEEEKRRAEKEGKTATAEFERLTNISETIGNLCSVYGNIFNHHTTMANIFKEPILCFDIKNLSLMNSEIFDAQVFNVLTLCWSNIVEVGGDMKRLWENGEIDWEDITRSFILIDEAHRWINANKTTAVAQIGQMEREGRKYFAGLGIASQQLRDFVPDHASREGIDEIKNLFELSTYKFILRQDSNTIDKFRQVLGNTCTDRELEQIPMLDQGETILSISGLGNIKFDVYVSEESLNLYRGGA